MTSKEKKQKNIRIPGLDVAEWPPLKIYLKSDSELIFP